MIGNSPKQETNIQVEMGKSFAFAIQFKSVDGTPLDLTGCTVRLVVAHSGRRMGSELLTAEADIAFPPQGLAQFRLQASDLAVAPSQYSYDVTLVSGLGYSTAILKGYFEVVSNVDYDDSNVYQQVYPQTDITAVLSQQNLVTVVIERLDGILSVALETIDEAEKRFRVYLTTAGEAAISAAKSQAQIHSELEAHKSYLQGMGFPYWLGNRDEYRAVLAPDPNVLYLITD